MVNNQVRPPVPGQKLGFQDVDKEVVATRGVKLRNKRAEKLAQEKKERDEYQAKFNKQAEKSLEYYNEKENYTVNVISRFLNMTKDKTLTRNKGSIVADVEREIRKELIQLAIDQNNDENEQDNGKGSVIILSVLTKIVLLFRDRMNDLEYEIQQLKKKDLSSQSSKELSKTETDASK